jgi:hypothetical protein
MDWNGLGRHLRSVRNWVHVRLVVGVVHRRWHSVILRVVSMAMVHMSPFHGVVALGIDIHCEPVGFDKIRR